VFTMRDELVARERHLNLLRRAENRRLIQQVAKHETLLARLGALIVKMAHQFRSRVRHTTQDSPPLASSEGGFIF
jgi:hypothetical protein